MGPAGSGKGTQADKIAQKYGLQHLTSGGLLREEAAKGTERGKMIQDLMDKGELTPTNLTNELLLNSIDKSDKGVILDGYPRNMEQVRWLDENIKIDKVIMIKLNDDEAVKRISGRRICKACGKMFHVDFNPSQQEGVCDYCGGELYQRDDDTPEAANKRLGIYHTQTDEVIQHYKEKEMVVEIDGKQSIEDVFKDIVEVLGE